MNRSERRRATRAMAKQAAKQLTAEGGYVQVRRTWAVTLASFVARVPMPARWKAPVCTRIVRLAQMRVGLGPWQRLPVEITP